MKSEPVVRRAMSALVAGPMTSLQVCDVLQYHPEHAQQRRQAAMNSYLRSGEIRGWIERTGWARGGRNVPARLWELTDLGAEVLLEPWPPPPSKTSQRYSEMRERIRAREAIAAMVIREGQDVGRYTPPEVRRRFARDWHDRGASLGQIAAQFGVSREMIRLDLLAPSQRRAS